MRNFTTGSLLIGLIVGVLACGPALAQDASCAAKAVSKDGKPLAGAAKASFVKKCCTASAIGKDGKPLHGAAKTSFVKKCESGG